MRKKIFNVIMATVLTVAMGVTAFAAESPTASGVVTGNTGKDANGEEIYYTVDPVKDEYASAASEIETKEGLKAAMGSSYTEGMEVVDVRSVSIHEKEIATYSADGSVAFPLTLTFNVPGVVKGTKVAVLSYVNGAWRMLQCVAGDGIISAVFDNEAQFGAVAFAVDKGTTAGGNGNQTTPGKDNQTGTNGNQTSGKNNQTGTNGSGNQTSVKGNQAASGNKGTSSTANSTSTNTTATNSKVSPKTGENTVLPLVTVAAVALLASGIYCLRKREAR